MLWNTVNLLLTYCTAFSGDLQPVAHTAYIISIYTHCLQLYIFSAFEMTEFQQQPKFRVLLNVNTVSGSLWWATASRMIFSDKNVPKLLLLLLQKRLGVMAAYMTLCNRSRVT